MNVFRQLLVILVSYLLPTLCDAQTSFKVNIGKDRHICIGNYTEIEATIEGGEAPFIYKWTPTDEIAETAEANITAAPTYTTTYHVEVTDARGRKAYDAVEIEVFFRPQLILPSSITIAPGESVTISAQLNDANGATTCTWKPSTGLDNTSSPTPIASPSATTTYTLKVKDSKGCVVTEKITVEVKGRGEFASGGKK